MSNIPANRGLRPTGPSDSKVVAVPAPRGVPRRTRVSNLVALIRGRAITISIVGLLLIFVLVLFGILRVDLKPTSWDVTITREIQELPGVVVGQILTGVSFFGFEPWNWFIPPIIVAFMLVMRWFEEAAFTALAALGGLLAEAAKFLINRPRPTPDLVHVVQVLHSYSFPSGHVTSYVTLYGFIFYLAYTLLSRKSIARLAVLVPMGTLLALIGVSRVYMGQHWASDVLAGYALGLAYLLCIIELHRWWLRRKTPHRRDSAEPIAGKELP